MGHRGDATRWCAGYCAGVTPLPETRRALAHARRTLDKLAALEDSVQEYRDQIGWVLDRLDNVWRSINDEPRGQRPDAFVQWWSQQRTETREAIRKLRNAEMKKNLPQTGAVSRARSRDRLRIHDDGRITLIREDGTEVRPGADGALHTTAMVYETRWTFVGIPEFEGQTVREALESVYMQLADDVVPTAERLLGP